MVYVFPQSEPQYVPAKFDDKASGTESDDCKSHDWLGFRIS